MEPNSGQKSRFMIILVNMFILAPEGQTHGKTKKKIRLFFKKTIWNGQNRPANEEPAKRTRAALAEFTNCGRIISYEAKSGQNASRCPWQAIGQLGTISRRPQITRGFPDRPALEAKYYNFLILSIEVTIAQYRRQALRVGTSRNMRPHHPHNGQN
jgi:hypothetical protein